MALIRTFIAIEIPDTFKQEVDRLIVKLKHYAPEVRWVRAANLHFTLRFLGDVDEVNIPKLSDSLNNRLNNQNTFKIKLSGLGCFPNMKRPRVIWLGAAGDMDSLKQTANQVETACRDTGFGKGDKSFSAHLTIGRIKQPRELEPLINKLNEIEFTSDDFEVERVTIFRSDLSPRGPKYTSLAKIFLSR